MTISPGRLRTRVDLLELVGTTDSAGGEKKSYAVAGGCMVEVVPLRGREFVEARQVVSEVTHKNTGHYEELKDVTDTHRIRDVETGHEYDVEVPLPDQPAGKVVIFAKRTSR